jgi:hypothetical protein
MRAKSMMRGYALPPPMISFGRSFYASFSTTS